MIRVLVIIFLLIAGTANAEYWCQWDGSAGTNCLISNSRQLNLPSGERVTVEEPIMNSFGYYKVYTTQPSINEGERKGSIIWDKVDNQLNRTWNVDTIPQTEIDANVCGEMKQTIWLTKKLVAKGVLNIGDFTVEEQSIYQACDRVD